MEMKSVSQINIRSPMFIVALFTIAKIRKEPKCPFVSEWIKQVEKKSGVCIIHNGTLFSLKGERNPDI